MDDKKLVEAFMRPLKKWGADPKNRRLLQSYLAENGRPILRQSLDRILAPKYTNPKLSTALIIKQAIENLCKH